MTQTGTHQDSLNAEQVGYKQSLGRRHVQMIAIGGAIGTGLFLGSASRLHSTGPALLLSYAFVGVIAYFLMRCSGRAGAAPRHLGRVRVLHAGVLREKSAAFVTGWLYWLNWGLTGIAELSAVGLYVQYWWPTMPTWATVLIALAVVLVINLLSARAFGEFEFWAAIAKVGAIVVFLVVGLVVVIGQFDIGGHAGRVPEPVEQPGWLLADHGSLPLVRPDPGDVRGGVRLRRHRDGGVAAGEMENSTREVPKAVNAVIFRIGVFYCGSILLLVCMLPTTEYKSGTSPFVTVFEPVGPGLDGAI